MKRCRNCKHFEYGYCTADLPIEVENELIYKIDNGDLAQKLKLVFDENGLNLDAETQEQLIEDIEYLVNNLISTYKIKVCEYFKCKNYE